ncbi:chain-length determining protein [Polaromonas sp. JS666]|uniref:chain-length determining protein n=1 Tax=Polaromonas sp. (strain JS666 / ATCC BAA-500) TaxID=296591 RepID=UPI001E3B20FF|nr:chain-length determining protein [Polaromonas sp. JS666]
MMSEVPSDVGLGPQNFFSRLPSLAWSGWKRSSGRRSLLAALLVFLVAAFYWGLIASDRYISEAHVVVDKTDLQSSTTVDFSSLITGGRNNHDLLLLRDHLRSVDMLNKLHGRLNLRAHYSDRQRDPLSRLWSADASQERFYQHYLSRTSIEMDDQAGVLVIRAQAYDAATAQKIAAALMQEGEAFLNNMAHQLAREQVIFLEQQVAQSSQRAVVSRRALINYQNSTGMISPASKAESLTAIAARFEGQISDLKARRAGMLGYLSPDAPDVAQINLQIAALERQAALDQGRLASPAGNTLNRNIEEFQRLEAEVAFAQDVYRTSLVALERGRLEAVRMLKKLSILQSPTLAEYPVEPQRIYNILIVAIGLLMLLGISSLFIAIIRDHQD